ncbi:lipopolysaccharide biosynthesis protein [Xanthomonas sp. NCPPB 3005]|jgi:O-antigen/teichoic acid export membrane protein|uniref:lipopolysaccharide biosynthesis protein n=1 Tax=Xanthomonas sp. NCPPB 3005 TaxID=3240913 RepID=UPI003519B1AE
MNAKLRMPKLGWLARNTLGTTLWHALRVASQLVWVLLLARVLGASGYGNYSGIAGLAVALGGFAGFGLGLRMYQDTARDHTLFPMRWQQAGRALAWSTPLLLLVYLVLGSAIFKQPGSWILLGIGLSEILFAPIIAQVASAYAAHTLVLQAAAVPVAGSLARVAAVGAFMQLESGQGLSLYVWLHLTALAACAILLRHGCTRRLLANSPNHSLAWNDLRAGIGLSGIWASTMAWTSVDKTFALRWGGEAIAGNFTAAQRFTGLATLPIEGLIGAALPRMFRQGAGMNEHPFMMRALLACTVAYGLVAALFLYFASGAIVAILGSDFASAAPVVKLLAWCAPISCMRILLAHWLLARSDIRARVLLETIGLCVLAWAMFAFTPTQGAIGSAWAIIAGECALVLLFSIRLITHRASAT